MSRFLTPLLLLLVTATSAFAQAPAAPAAPMRSITKITGELYRAQNVNHYTVFLVTPDGIIMSDPINRDFATWLKGELTTRFKQPVKYVLYTHRDWDHASGGGVFADTAQFVGHVNMLAALAPPAGNPPLAPDTARQDLNGNGMIDRTEATGQFADRFAAFDHNGDGRLSGGEIVRGSLGDVHPPTITYTGSEHTVTLGTATVRMLHLGDAHANDSSVLYFPAERAVFSADILQVKRLPNALTPNIGAWIDALRTINSLDYQYALTGHALAGTKQDAIQAQRYLEDLSAGVVAGIAAGRSLAEIQKTLTLDAYKGFERWDTVRMAHIAAVYGTIRGTRPAPTTATR
jgi:glyoxylase-like metal-dependent hydrolase (beta-lactamase superfamily II)